MPFTQKNRLIAIDTPLGKDALLLSAIQGNEGISTPFSFELDLLSADNSIKFKDIIGKNVTVSIVLADGEKRYFNGVISRFAQGPGEDSGDIRLASYTATMVPWLWLLTRTADSRIFQNLSVPEIVEKVFKDLDFLDFKFDLGSSYDKRGYCVQYRETDFNFVCRLLEEEGIFYFFEHKEKKHTLVMADVPDKHKPCPKQNDAWCELTTGGTKDKDMIGHIEVTQEITAGKCTLNDFNFEAPGTDLKVEAPSQKSFGPGEREMYDYPGGFGKRAGGERLANIRMEKVEAEITTISGSSRCRAFTSGYKFTLKDFYRDDMNEKDYVLTSVSHSASQGYSPGSGGSMAYSNMFTCIPYDVTYRPPRVTPRPVVEGPQTAIVVGPSGEEIHTDEHGRVKVQFHWDREGSKDDKSSCWIRVSQLWAGAGWGAMHIPHVGHEVIVDFLEGDPDRPIITGRVYHGTNKPPDELPGNKTKNHIQSWGGNDIIFENKDGDKSIHIKQACGNEIRMHEAEGIQMRDKYGNEVVLDAADGFIRIASPSHNSYIELGKSLITYTDSSGVEFTAGDKESEVVGNYKETFVGTKISKNMSAVFERNLSLKASETVGLSQELFLGAKLGTMLGLNVTFDYAKQVGQNFRDKIRRTHGVFKIDSEKKIHLLGGAGNASQVVLDSANALISSKDSFIHIKKNGEIKIQSKGNVNIIAEGEIYCKTKTKGIRFSTPNKFLIDGAIKQKNLLIEK